MRLLVILGALVAGVIAGHRPVERVAVGVVQHARGRHTVADRVGQYGPAVRARLTPDFERTGVAWPPRRITLVGLKHERRLEVYVGDGRGPLSLLRSYPVLAASGRLGPKLREGDRQVPEGRYRVASLNPNSAFHLSLRLNYPSPDDLSHAWAEGRKGVGQDIMIHGSQVSAGCLAMGDEAAEDLFVLAAQAGAQNVAVLLSPVDFRVRDLPPNMPPAPAWMAQRYAQLRTALAELPGFTPLTTAPPPEPAASSADASPSP